RMTSKVIVGLGSKEREILVANHLCRTALRSFGTVRFSASDAKKKSAHCHGKCDSNSCQKRAKSDVMSQRYFSAKNDIRLRFGNGAFLSIFESRQVWLYK